LTAAEIELKVFQFYNSVEIKREEESQKEKYRIGSLNTSDLYDSDVSG
jgi:hypothetical protein